MRVLVTGAGGYVGAHLVHRLLAAGHTPIATARRAVDLPCDVRLADLADRGAMPALLRDIDAVVHAAARVGHATQAVFERDNVTAVRELVTHLEGRRIVHLSSVVVYGMGRHLDTDEDAPISPGTDGYAVSKAHGEAIVQAARSPWVVVRPGVIWGGPGDQRLMPVVRKVASLGVMLYPGPCRSPMPFAHIDNVCDVALAALSPDAPRSLVVNATDGAVRDGWSMSLRGFVGRYAAAAGRPLRLELVAPAGPIRGAVAMSAWLSRHIGLTWPQSLRPEVVTLFNTACTFSMARARSALGVSPRPREHLAM
jgi:nucleoside-diphosphate-sugar epimerase